MRDKIIGDWRKLFDEELHYLHSSLNIIRMTESRKIRWAGYVAQMGEKRNAYVQVCDGKARRKETTRKA
jgi:hypothetical protein